MEGTHYYNYYSIVCLAETPGDDRERGSFAIVSSALYHDDPTQGMMASQKPLSQSRTTVYLSPTEVTVAPQGAFHLTSTPE